MVGRNDPCPCGSGNKYKKCCWAKDRAAHAERVEANRSLGQPPEEASSDFPEAELAPAEVQTSDLSPAPEIDPLAERADAFWDEFIDAPYENQWAAVTRMLAEEPELCDGEMVFEIANTLFDKALHAGEIVRYDQLLDLLEETVPEAYEEELPYVLERRVQIALMEGDDVAVRRYFYQYSALVEDSLDLYYRLVTSLAYHGKEEILYDGMRQALPYIVKHRDVDDWASDTFAEKLGKLEIVHLLAKNPDLMVDDSTLQQHFEEYELTIEPEYFAVVLDYRTGRQIPNWTVADFEITDIDLTQKRFYFLLAAFTHYAHLEEGISRTKAEMAFDELGYYFMLRSRGELGESGQARGKRQKRRRKLLSKPPMYEHPLCPNARTLDRYLGELMGFFSYEYYEAFALFELIPAWLRFLTKYNLLERGKRFEVYRELSLLKDSMIKIAEQSVYDPAMLDNLLDWPYETQGEL